jgi:uncharacterized protein (DUF1684 family)
MPSFTAEWQAWREARKAELRKPEGWLALVGLHWLEEGENRVPGLPGVFTLRGRTVAVVAAPADGCTIDGVPVTERSLAPDTAGRPDRLRVGSRSVRVIERGDRFALRVWDEESPARARFDGIDCFPPDPRWRVEARFEPYLPPREVEIPSAAGPAQRARVPGRVRFAVEGREVTLEPTADGEALFFVFKDATAPKETYGAGRMLDAAAPSDGRVVLDFNRAYNPPCAFTPHATCPLPRPENVLAIRIEAGEKKPSGH